MDSHWFGSLDPDPQREKKAEFRIRIVPIADSHHWFKKMWSSPSPIPAGTVAGSSYCTLILCEQGVQEGEEEEGMRGRLVLLGRAPATQKTQKSRLYMLPSHTPQGQFLDVFAFKKDALSSVFTLEYIYISNLETFGKRFSQKNTLSHTFQSMSSNVL
jgi:hypothetical protein